MKVKEEDRKAETGGNGNPYPFADNLDYLQSLRGEARLTLRIADLRKRAQTRSLDQDAGEFPEFEDAGEAGKDLAPKIAKMEKSLKWMKDWNLRRAQVSQGKIEPLHFFELSGKLGLEPFERDVLLLLFMHGFDPFTLMLFQKIEEDSRSRYGIRIGLLLEILCPAFRDQLRNKAYFGLDGTLRKNQLLFDYLGMMDGNESVMDERISIHQRVAHYIMGDETVYHPMLRCTRSEEPSACLEQVVMGEDILAQVLEQIDAFDRFRRSGASREINDHFGYGTGLAMLFYGPSGTGKTMLAHALARRMEVPIISVNLGAVRNMSSEDVMQYAFREGSISGGVVYFDECDDIFKSDSNESRAMLVEIEKSQCVTILTTNQPMKLDPALERRLRIKVRFAEPDEPSRRKIWGKLLPGTGLEVTEQDISMLSKRYVFTGGIIKNAVLTALNLAEIRKCQVGGALLREACDIQADSLVERTRAVKVYRPHAGIGDFSFPRPFRERLENLGRSVKVALDKDRPAAILVKCTDVATGAGIVEAIAKYCDVCVRSFDMRDVLRLKGEAEMKEEERIFPSAPFARQPGHRSISLVVDRFDDLGRFISRDREQGGVAEELANCFESSTEAVFIATRPWGRIRPDRGISFDSVLEVPHPSVAAQADAWRKHAGEKGLTEEEATELAEEYPMHVREIGVAVASIAFEREGFLKEDIPFSVAARRFLSRDKALLPVLFGKGR